MRQEEYFRTRVRRQTLVPILTLSSQNPNPTVIMETVEQTVKEIATPKASTSTSVPETESKTNVGNTDAGQSIKQPGQTIRSLAERFPWGNGQREGLGYSGNNQAASLRSVPQTAIDSSVNFNPISAGIRAVGDIGSSLVGGAFSLAQTNANIDWQKQQWQKNWDTAREMGLYSPDQIGNAVSGTPSGSDIYRLNSRGLSRQPRTRFGSPFGTT